MEINVQVMRELFETNREYAFDESTECLEFKINRRFCDMSSVFSICNYEDGGAPRSIPQEMIFINTIARLGGAGLMDILKSTALRVAKNPLGLNYRLNSVKELKDILDYYVDSSILARVKIKNKKKTYYLYGLTGFGNEFLNKRFDKNYRDQDSRRLFSDLNMRDTISKMAVSHAILFFEEKNWNVLQNRFSNVRHGKDRYPGIVYDSQNNKEVMLNTLYFRQDDRLETEHEFEQRVRIHIESIFEWVMAESKMTIGKESASRDVVLLCNDYNDYLVFVNTLCRYFGKTDYFKAISHIYATSVGLLDSDLPDNQKFYHRTKIVEEQGQYKAVGDAFEFIF